MQATLIWGWWGISKYPPPTKNFWKTPLKISRKFFEKQGNTEKIRLI